jgi:hypothetical protein
MIGAALDRTTQYFTGLHRLCDSFSFPGLPANRPKPLLMANFRLELDAPNNIVMVMVVEEDGSEHDYQFDFDPRSGRWEFAERDLLERDFGEDWVEDFEDQVETMIQGAVAKEE